ncbi:unnamed protein product, partial [Pylaiella littoralis]
MVAPSHLDDGNQHFCCNSKCNTQWSKEALSRTRSKLERYGKGTQTVRKVFVRECISSETRQLHVRDGMNALAVCWRFYRALMGVSFNLIRSAGGLGPVHTIRREAVNTAGALINVWLCELASHWELQPDKTEIHMSFPDAK